MEDGEDSTESINRALKVMWFSIYTGLQKTQFDIHHGRKPRTKLTNTMKDGKSFLSDWSELSILAPNKSKIPIYVGRDAEWEIANYVVMARAKTEERQSASKAKSPKKIPVRYLFNFVEKRHNRKFLEGRFQSKIQTAISGAEITVKTDTGQILHRKLFSGPLFKSEKRHRRETVPTVSAEIPPKYCHCLRGLDGKNESGMKSYATFWMESSELFWIKSAPKQNRKTVVMTMTKKRYRGKPEQCMTHRREMEDMRLWADPDWSWEWHPTITHWWRNTSGWELKN